MVGSKIFRHIEQFQAENITKHLEYKQMYMCGVNKSIDEN